MWWRFFPTACLTRSQILGLLNSICIEMNENPNYLPKENEETTAAIFSSARLLIIMWMLALEENNSFRNIINVNKTLEEHIHGIAQFTVTLHVAGVFYELQH